MRRLLPEPAGPIDPVAAYADLPAPAGRPGVRLNMVSSIDGAIAVDGLSPRESRAVLGLLFDQLNDPAFHYRHRWQTGDLVMWDEHTTVHMGPHDFFPAHRRLTRVTAGSRPPAPAFH